YALDEPDPLEQREIIAPRVETAGLTQRGADIPDNIPAVCHILRGTGLVDLVQRVVRVLQVGFVQDHHQDPESVVRPGPDKRIAKPGPFAHIFQDRVLRAKPSLRLYAWRGPPAEGPPGQVVHRWLVISDRRQDAGRDDFNLRFGPLLDAPLHAVLISDREPGAHADGLLAHKGVGRRWIGCEVFSPG